MEGGKKKRERERKLTQAMTNRDVVEKKKERKREEGCGKGWEIYARG